MVNKDSQNKEISELSASASKLLLVQSTDKLSAIHHQRTQHYTTIISKLKIKDARHIIVHQKADEQKP